MRYRKKWLKGGFAAFDVTDARRSSQRIMEKVDKTGKTVE